MQTSEADILIVPEHGGAAEDHWQSRWEAKLSTARRIARADWDRFDLSAWADALKAEVAAATRPVILVTHGHGAYAAAHAVEAYAGKVAGAFLVAPPAPLASDNLGAPTRPLPFPAVLVASRNDPQADYAASTALAAAWGAELADAGLSGHLDSTSGHGPWPEGLMRFAGFLKKL